MLAQATLLVHPKPDAPTNIVTDASDVAVGAVLQQLINCEWHPIAYFSKQLKPQETRYSAFDRELLAIYLAIKHFRHFIEGCNFHILTDHKPLTHALSSKPDNHSPRQIRHLDFISQFTSDIRYIKGGDNTAADALSRINNTTTAPLVVDFHEIAKAQLTDNELKQLRSSSTPSSLKLQPIPLSNSSETILCDMSTGVPRPFIPTKFRRIHCKN